MSQLIIIKIARSIIINIISKGRSAVSRIEIYKLLECGRINLIKYIIDPDADIVNYPYLHKIVCREYKNAYMQSNYFKNKADSK